MASQGRCVKTQFRKTQSNPFLLFCKLGFQDFKIFDLTLKLNTGIFAPGNGHFPLPGLRKAKGEEVNLGEKLIPPLHLNAEDTKRDSRLPMGTSHHCLAGFDLQLS